MGGASTSRGVGFPGLWRVAKEYVIVGGLLREERETERLYFPVSHRELPSEISKLKNGDEEAVIHFARDFGCFGYPKLIEGHANTQGEPLKWIWAHADTIRLCLRLLEGLQDKNGNIPNRELLEEVLGDLATPQSSPCAKVAYGAKVRSCLWSLGAASRGEVENLAAMIVKDLINKNLKGISPYLFFDESNNTWRQFFSYRALIQVAYWHLANYATGGRIARCEAEQCGALFLQTDGRQRFCPPRLSAKGESLCAIRQRQRKFQAGRNVAKKPAKRRK